MVGVAYSTCTHVGRLELNYVFKMAHSQERIRTGWYTCIYSHFTVAYTSVGVTFSGCGLQYVHTCGLVGAELCLQNGTQSRAHKNRVVYMYI